MDKKITPKSLILGLLQASNNLAIPVKGLVVVGEIFGFTGNTIRVTTTRLIREGTIESNERGFYRLSDRNSLYRTFFESWRLGESRLREWNGEWLCCLLPQTRAKMKSDTKRAFEFAGFREGLPNLWVRPDNLTTNTRQVEDMLTRFGKLEKSELFVAKDFSENLTAQWLRYLWPSEQRHKNQQACLEKIEQSMKRLEKLPLKDALIESFLVGSETIFQLVTDPLLPDRMMEGTLRKKLTDAMLEYDELGKKIWTTGFLEIRIVQSPAHLKLVS